MFNASVRPSVRPSVRLKPKFSQLFDLSCLNLRGPRSGRATKKILFANATFFFNLADGQNPVESTLSA